MKKLFYFSAALFSLAVQAQEIETDRPDQTENSALVPKGRFQFETVIMHEQTGKHESEFMLPEVLGKYGLGNAVELRLTTEFLYDKGETDTYGLHALQVGTKIKILENEGTVPAISLITQLQLPKVESPEFRTEHLAPEIRLVLRNELSDKADVGYNTGIRWDGNSTQPEYFYTFAPNFKLTDKLQAFVESFGYFQVAHHGHQWADGGLAFKLNDDLQLDFAAGYELTKTEGYHHFFESVGFSLRI
ncbi:transporter [Flavobacterium limi]|uniref:MetA-pathway of phenol degradation n=1 Tax=Flavobacterium limi TaxID=2045105 RepID=A0ABQ1UYH2_9FLAO|nr:transporter [Flavobacterium limi]GGF28348.1 hypothetical protein GCM10011518_42090 [Flavobacterium limi]